MARKNQFAVGLDVGSAWTRLVALSADSGVVRYRGHAAVPARGWHRGQLADQNAVAETVRAAVRDAEALCGDHIGSAVVGVGGPGVRSQQGRGVYDFGRSRAIDQKDLAWTVNLAAKARLDNGRFLLQALAQDFTVDGQAPMLQPLNVECQRLEAHALLLTASAQEHQALVSAVNQASLRVDETVFEPMAAAYASILPDERGGGVALVDIGAHSTNAVYYDGDAMLFGIGMPVSGDHFTRDVGEVKSLSFDEAERLKIAHGCALLGLTADNIIIELPSESGRPAREISRRELIETLEARAMQLFELVERFRIHGARDLALREGAVLVGGASQLEGMVEVAEKVLGCPARLGFARGIFELPGDLMSPVWTTAVGLAMYAARLQTRIDNRPAGLGLWSLLTGRA